MSSAIALLRGTLVHVAMAHFYAQRHLRAGFPPLTLPIESVNKQGRLLIGGGPSKRGWHYYAAHMTCPQLHAIRHIVEVDQRDPWVDDDLRIVSDPEELSSPEYAMSRRVDREDTATGMRAYTDAANDYRKIANDLAVFPAPRVLAIEREVEMIIRSERTGADHLFTQRLDLAVLDPNDEKVYVIDHKRLAYLSKDMGAAYAIDGQYLGYWLHGERRWGSRFGGVRLHAVNATAGSKMIELPRIQKLLDELPQLIAQAGDEIEAARAARTPPLEYRKVLSNLTCCHRYGLCDGWKYCRGPIS